MITTPDGLNLFAQTLGTGSDTLLVPNRVYMQQDFQHLATRRTVIFCDPRNRGLSDTVTDPIKLERGIHHDVEDIETIRLHVGATKVAILAHSYLCVAAVLYAIAHPEHVSRLVLIGPPPPDPTVAYPAPKDGVLEDFQQKFMRLQAQRAAMPDDAFCQACWALLRALYVVHPASADRLHWAPCGMPNEVNFMQPFLQYIQPSLSALRLTPAEYAQVTAPVLIVRGKQDRSAPCAGARDWAHHLPNARLLTVADAAHVPWIEAPDLVFGAIDSFLREG